MAFYIVAGAKLNHLSRASVPPTVTPGVDALYPKTNLYDDRPVVPMKFSAASTDAQIVADLNHIINGDFETVPVSPATTPPGWTASAGTFTRDTAIFLNGVASGKLVHTSATNVYQDYVVRSGEARKSEWSIYGGGGAIAAAIRLQNKDTGKYLRTDGTWGAAQDLLSQTAASWVSAVKQYTVEAVSETLTDLTTLRVYVTLSASGTIQFEDIYDYPATDLCAVFGHNIGKILTPQFSIGATNLTLVPRHPSFYGRLSAPLYQRYATLNLLGTPYTVPWIGELVFAQTVTLSRTPTDLSFAWRDRQSRMETPGGAMWVTPRNAHATREGTLKVKYSTVAEYEQSRDQLYRRSRGGLYPLILMPTAPDPAEIIFGRLGEEVTYDYIDGFVSYRQAQFILAEEPIPTMV